MSYLIVLAGSFKSSLCKLKKRYRRIKEDIKPEIEELTRDPRKWPVMPGARGVRKARVSNSDANKGKSGGYRLLYFVEDQPRKVIYILWVYSKSDMSNVAAADAVRLVEEMKAALDNE